MLSTLVKEVQSNYGMTNAAIGRILNYSPEMVSKIRSGERNLPVEAATKLAEMEPKVALEMYAGIPNSVLSTGWLDGDVDLSMMAVHHKALEEIQELVDDLSGLRIVNKTAYNISVVEMDNLLHVRQEALDVIQALTIWLVTGAKHFNIDMDAEKKEHRQKLLSKRYIKKDRL